MHASIRLYLMRELEIRLHEHDVAGACQLKTSAEEACGTNQKLVVSFRLLANTFVVHSVCEGFDDGYSQSTLATIHIRVYGEEMGEGKGKVDVKGKEEKDKTHRCALFV